MPRFNTAADLLLDRGLNSLVCVQLTPIPVGGTELSQVNTSLKAYVDSSRCFEHWKDWRLKGSQAAREGTADISISQKHCSAIICSRHPVTPKAGEGTVDRKTQGKKVRKVCQGYLYVSARGTAYMYTWMWARMWKGGLGTITVKPYTLRQLQLPLVTLPGTNLTATGSSSGLRSNE